jgi:hypothetical protein
VFGNTTVRLIFQAGFFIAHKPLALGHRFQLGQASGMTLRLINRAPLKHWRFDRRTEGSSR